MLNCLMRATVFPAIFHTSLGVGHWKSCSLKKIASNNLYFPSKSSWTMIYYFLFLDRGGGRCMISGEGDVFILENI